MPANPAAKYSFMSSPTWSASGFRFPTFNWDSIETIIPINKYIASISSPAIAKEKVI